MRQSARYVRKAATSKDSCQSPTKTGAARRARKLRNYWAGFGERLRANLTQRFEVAEVLVATRCTLRPNESLTVEKGHLPAAHIDQQTSAPRLGKPFNAADGCQQVDARWRDADLDDGIR